MGLLEIRTGSTLQASLTRMQANAQAAHELLPVIAEMLVAGVLDVFEAEGPGWAPLAEATLRQRRRDGKDAKILQDTGMMAGRIAPGWGDTYAEAFSAVSYAVYHVSKEPRHKLPLRDFFNLGPYESPLLDEVAALITSQVV